MRREVWAIGYTPHRKGYTRWLTKQGWSEPKRRGTYPPPEAMLFLNYMAAIQAKRAAGWLGRVRRFWSFRT
jgi:hypothetical protein